MQRSLFRAHPWTVFVLVVALVGVAVFGSAAGAQAAIWPKGFNPKQYMLNVLSSMLAQASPDSKLGSVKRSVVQADQQYDHSWEALEELWKKDATKVPQTHEDYVLQKQQYFKEKGIKGIQGQLGTPENTGKGTKYVKPIKAPATKTKGLIRAGVGVGVGVGASVGWGYRADIGSSVSGLFGIDAAGAVCSAQDELGKASAAVNFITGQDCDAWAVDNSLEPNSDVTGGSTMMVCLTGAPSDCVTYKSSGPSPGAASFTTYCYVASGSLANKETPPSLAYWVNGNSRAQPDGTQNSNWTSWRPVCGDGRPNVGLELNPGQTLTGLQLAQNYNSGSDTKPVGFAKSTDNPDRSFACTYTLDDGSTVEKESDTFKETDAAVPQPVCPAAPDDKGVKNVNVSEVNKDTGKKTPVYDDPTTDAYQKWWAAYPECRDGACSLDLHKKGSKSDSCFDSTDAAAECQSWMADPDKTANYQCTYGAHNVDLTECYAYGDVFKPEKVLAGQAYTDPSTGKAVDGQSSPNAARSTLGRTWTDPQDFSGCLDDGWAAANPIEWVMIPVQCSLQWAFAPSQQVITTTTNKAQNQWASKGPGKVTNAVAGWHFTAPTGCDIPVTVLGTRIDLANACAGGPMAGLATLSKVATSAVFAVLCFFSCRRIIRGWVNDNDGNDGGSDL